MKNPADYLVKSDVSEARRPRRDLQPVVAYADAVQAVTQARPMPKNTSICSCAPCATHADDLIPAAAPRSGRNARV
ncbi:MAG: hypothetical protein WKG07_12905 [Hymenobacter sp.]